MTRPAVNPVYSSDPVGRVLPRIRSGELVSLNCNQRNPAGYLTGKRTSLSCRRFPRFMPVRVLVAGHHSGSGFFQKF
jgi:hypothetical protein